MKFKTLFSFWFLWRAGLFLLSAIAIIIIPTFGKSFPYYDEILKSSGLPAWLWQFGNFDGVHYLGIAKDGYIRQYTQAFFPVYPLLIRTVAPIFFNNFILAGIALSSIFTLLSAWMLIKLITNNKIWILIFFIFFPMSFFYGAIYSESFFLFLVFTCFYFAKKRSWLMAGIFGMLASGTRLIGVFLLPAMLYELFNKNNNTKYKIQNTIYIFLIPLGLLAYMLYLQINFHDALYFLHAQGVFGASRSTGVVFPLITLWRYVKILATVPFLQYDFWVAFWEAGFFVGGLTILLICSLTAIKQRQKGTINISYLIFSWLCFLLPTATGTLSSFPRYLLVCFPIYIFLGNLEEHVKSDLLYIFLILNSFFSILFLRGYWVS